jgi:hypothetical protein
MDLNLDPEAFDEIFGYVAVAGIVELLTGVELTGVFAFVGIAYVVIKHL